MHIPNPTEQKTVQSRILAYAQEIGWTYVPREEAERRRGFDPGGITSEDCAMLHQLMTVQIRVHDLDLEGILQRSVAEIGDATVNPPIVGNGRDRSLRGNRPHNRPVQDRGNES